MSKINRKKVLNKVANLIMGLQVLNTVTPLMVTAQQCHDIKENERELPQPQSAVEVVEHAKQPHKSPMYQMLDNAYSAAGSALQVADGVLFSKVEAAGSPFENNATVKAGGLTSQSTKKVTDKGQGYWDSWMYRSTVTYYKRTNTTVKYAGALADQATNVTNGNVLNLGGAIQTMESATRIFMSVVYSSAHVGSSSSFKSVYAVIPVPGTACIWTTYKCTTVSQTITEKATYRLGTTLQSVNANGTIQTINAGGTQMIFNGAKGSIVTMNGGTQIISAGGQGYLLGTMKGGVINNAGTAHLNGTLSGGQITGSGNLMVDSGGTVYDYGTTTLPSGKTVNVNGTWIVKNSAVYNTAFKGSGTLRFASNTTMSAAYVGVNSNVVDNGVILTLTGGNLAGNISMSGTTGQVKITGAVTNTGNKTISVNNLTVSGSLTTNADKLIISSGSITNSGANATSVSTLTLTGGSITEKITGNYGKTVISGAVDADGKIDNYSGATDGITVTSGGALTIDADNVGTGVKLDSGTITLETGTLAKAISGSNGTVNIGTSGAAAQITSSQKITAAKGINLTNASSKLSIGASNVGGDINSKGGITLTGSSATLAYNINGCGSTPTYGTVTVDGTITLTEGKKLNVNTLTINSSKSLTANANDITSTTSGVGAATIDNKGTLILTGGVLNKDVTSSGGTGTVKVANGKTVTLAETTAISTQNVTLDGTLKFEAAAADKTIANALTINSTGTLDLRDSNDRTYTVTSLTGNNGSISFDMVKKTGSSHGGKDYLEATDHDILKVNNGTANGYIKLGSINMDADIYELQSGDPGYDPSKPGKLEFDSITLVGVGGTGSIDSGFKIQGTTTQYGDFIYGFTQDGTNKGQLNITKTAATFGLREIINAENQKEEYNANAAGVGTYSFNSDITNVMPYATYKASSDPNVKALCLKIINNVLKAYGDAEWDGTTDLSGTSSETHLKAYDSLIQNKGLGTLNPANGKTLRILTINGNGKTLNGGGFAGVTVKGETGVNAGTLNIVNVSNVSNFKDNVVVTNDGTLMVKDSTMQLNAGVKDSAGTATKGVLTLENSTITLGTFVTTNKETDYQIIQKSMTIRNNATLNAYAADLTVESLENLGILNLWGGDSDANRSVLTGTIITGNTGTVNIASGQYIGIASGKTVAAVVNVSGDLEAEASAFAGGSVNNTGTLNLKAGDLGVAVSGAGTVNVLSGQQVNNKSTLIAKDLNIASTAVLNTPANTLTVTNTIDDDGELRLTGGSAAAPVTFANAVSGDGVITVNGNIIATKALATTGNSGQGIAVSSNKSLQLNTSLLGTNVANSGTVYLDADTTDAAHYTLSKVITGGKIVMNGNVTSDVANLKGEVTNDSGKNLTVTGGTDAANLADLTVAVKGAGALTVNGFVNATGKVENTISVDSGKVLAINADNVGNTVLNQGTLKLGAGTLNYTLSDSTGDLIITGAVVNKGGNSITQANLTTTTTATSLQTNVNDLHITNAIANGGVMKLLGTGSIDNAFNGTGGTLYIGDSSNKSSITLNGAIENAVEVRADSALFIAPNNVKGNITDNGIVTLNAAGTLAKDVSGTGKLTVTATNAADVVNATASNIVQKDLEITQGVLQIDPSKVNISSKNIMNAGTLQLVGTASSLDENITGSGTTVIPKDSVITVTGELQQQSTVQGTMKIDPDNIKGDVTLDNTGGGAGKVETIASGSFNKMIGGSGEVVVKHDVTMSNSSGFVPVSYVNATNPADTKTPAEYAAITDPVTKAQYIPVSGINVDLDAKLTVGSNISGGALKGLTIQDDGHLNLNNGGAGILMVAGDFTAVNGSKLSLDIIDDTNMDSLVITGNATGILSLDTVSIANELMQDKQPAAGESAVGWRDAIKGYNNLTINGTVVMLGNYMYTISYEANPGASNIKQLKIVKEIGFSLPVIINAGLDIGRPEAGKINTYSINQDAINTNHSYVRGGDLGELKHKSGDSKRDFTISATNNSLNGGGFAGITMNLDADTLNLSGLSAIDNFDNGIVVNNAGSMKVSDSTILLGAKVLGTGNLTVSDAQATVKDVGYYTTRVTSFKGEVFRINADGKYVDASNNVLADQSMENVRVNGVMEDYEGKASGAAPIPGWYVGTTFYSLADAVTIALSKFAADQTQTSHTVASGVEVKIIAPVIQQKNLTIATAKSSITTNADRLDISSGITNNGTLTLTGGTLNEQVTGASGTTVIDGDVKLTGNMGNKVTVNSGKSVTVDASLLGNEMTNSGNVILTGGILGQNIKDGTSSGKITVNGAVSANADNLQSRVVNATAGNVLVLTGGSISKDITGTTTYGDLKVTGDVTNSGGAIHQANLNVVSGSFTTPIEKLTVDTAITNAGTLTLTGSGKNAATINGSGTMNIGVGSTLTQNAGLTQNILNIMKLDGSAAGGSLTIATNDLAVTTLNNGGTLTLTGDGTLQEQIDAYKDAGSVIHAGTVFVDGNIGAEKAIKNNITIINGKQLTINAANVGGAVTNNGTLVLVGGADLANASVLCQTVTGGVLNIEAGVIANGNDNAINVKTMNVAKNGVFSVNGGELTLTDGYITNDGVLEITGGKLQQEVKSNYPGSIDNIGGQLTITGSKLVVSGDVTLEKTVASAVVVNGGANLQVKPEYVIGGVVLNSVTNLAKLTVDQSGTFNSVVGGQGTVILNSNVTMGSNAAFLPAVYLNAADNYKQVSLAEYENLSTEAKAYCIPVSGVDLALNAEMKIGNMGASKISSGAVRNLTLGTNGHLNLNNDKAGTMIVAGNFVASPGSKLSLDVINDSTMDAFAVLGTASGQLSLGDVNIVNELIKDVYIQVGDKKYYGRKDGTKDVYYDKEGQITEDENEYVEITNLSGTQTIATWKDIPINHDNLSITSTVVVSGSYSYKIEYLPNPSANNDKQLKITKGLGFTLHQVNQGETNASGTNGAVVSSYSMTSDAYNVATVNSVNIGGGKELGTMTRVDASGANTSGGATNRELTINGNGYTLNGSGWDGIKVQEGDTLNLKNLAKVINFAKGIVAVNDGTLALSGGEVNVAASVQDTSGGAAKGVLSIENANVTLAPAEQHFTKGAQDMTADATGVSFKDNTSAECVLGTKQIVTIKQKEINIRSGSLTAQPSQLDVETIANDAVLNLNEATDGNNNTFDAKVIGDGEVVVKEGMTNLTVKNSIANNVIVEGNATVGDFDVDYVKKSITNDGALYLTGDTQDNDTLLSTVSISGEGTVYIGKKDGTGVIGQKVSSEGSLESAVNVVKDSTLNINAGTVSGALINSGNVNVAVADSLAGDGEITNSGTLTVGKGTLDRAVANTTGILNANAGNGGTIIVNRNIDGGTVKVNSGMMVYTGTSKIGDVLVVESGAELDPLADTLADNTTINGGLYLSGGILSTDIKGASGITYLKENKTAGGATVTVNSNQSIEGSLDGSDGTLKMTGDNTQTTLTVGTLGGTTKLQIDVDMSSFTADKLAVGAMNGTVNLTGINITNDVNGTFLAGVGLSVETDDAITYVSGKNGTDAVAGGTYQINGSDDEIIVLTNGYKYTFAKGTTDGTLKFMVDATEVTFKKFVEGELDGTTLSLNKDMVNGGSDIATITQGNKTPLTVNLNGNNLISASQSTIVIGEGKEFNLNGGNGIKSGYVDSNTVFSVAGNLNVTGNTVINGTVSIADTGSLNIDVDSVGANITAAKDAQITLTTNGVDEDDLVGRTHVDQLRHTIDGGKITLTGDLTDDGTHLIDTNGTGELTVADGKTLTITGTSIGRDVTGSTGITKFTNTGDINLDRVIANTLIFDPGANVTISDVTGYGPMNNPGVTNIGGGILQNDVLGSGTLHFTGDTTVTASQTCKTFTQDAGVNLSIPLSVLGTGDTATTKAAFTNLTTFPTIAPSAILTITGCEALVDNQVYTLILGDAITSIEDLKSLWQTIATDTDDFELVYAASADGGELFQAGMISLKALALAKWSEDAMIDDPGMMKRYKEAGGEQKAFYNTVKALYNSKDESKMQTARNALNSITNLNGMAEVNTNVAEVSLAVLDNITNYASLGSRPIVNVHEGMKVQKTAAPAVEVMTPDYVEIGKADNLMPERAEKVAYAKEVWASYVHSKDDIDGMKAGHLLRNSKNQFNGTTVGVDLWSGAKSFGGMSLSYVDATINGNNSAANVRNKVKNYGVNFYHRQDMGEDSSLLFNVGYIQAKNDINLYDLGFNITAEPKVEAYSAGMRYEKSFNTGRSKVIPYAGVNYSFVKTGDYSNSWGDRYEVSNQHLVNVPFGLKWTGEFQMPDSVCTWRPRLEVGYSWNFGGRNNSQIVNHSVTTEFDTLDRGNYFVKAGMDFVYKKFTLGVGYNYSKGEHIRTNRWKVDVNWQF